VGQAISSPAVTGGLIPMAGDKIACPTALLTKGSGLKDP
jgi:hypothetical protein